MTVEVREYKRGNTLGITFGRTRRSVWLNVRSLWIGIRFEYQHSV